MYRDRGGGGGGSSKSEIMGGTATSLDRKRINDALDKHLEKSSPSTSRGLKDKSSVVASNSTGVSGGAGKSHQQLDHRDNRSSSTLTNNKIKASDG